MMEILCYKISGTAYINLNDFQDKFVEGKTIILFIALLKFYNWKLYIFPNNLL